MHQVDRTAVRKWRKHGSRKVPDSVDVLCPYCRKDVNFALRLDPGHFDGAPKRVECPRCHDSPIFVSIDFDGDGENELLFIHPDPVERRPLPLDGISALSPNLKETYTSAVRIYSMGEWRASASLVRTVLEGATGAVLGDVSRSTLAQRLQQLSQKDLGGPIREMADVLRKGGNLASHFDELRAPDEETATEMVDFMDYLLEYLFVVPSRVEALRSRILNEPPQSSSADMGSDSDM